MLVLITLACHFRLYGTVRQQLATLKQGYYDACLANFYRNGQDYMGWHSDNEASLGPTPYIASLSLGAARDFIFRHKQNKQRVAVALQHGDLLVMFGHCQRDWQHALPQRKRVTEPRINLTFRQMISC